MAYSSEELKQKIASEEDKTDLVKMEAIADDAVDDSDIPDGFWEEAVVAYPSVKKPISFRVEEELLAWYREEARRKDIRGYQSLMHSVLASYKKQQDKSQHDSTN